MNYSLKSWNTFGIKKYAKNIVLIRNLYQLLSLQQETMRYKYPILTLGKGSNVLFTDNFSGTIIINRITGIDINESSYAWHLHVGAGENWHQLVKFTIYKNMPGLENLALIPGCVGASPIQNIGAYGVELKDVCEYVDYIEFTTGKLKRLTAKECCFGYRDSIFKNRYNSNLIIIAIGLRLYKKWKPKLNYNELFYLSSKKVTPKQIFNIICKMRLNKLPNPKTYGNAGSFFKNPIIDNRFFQKIVKKWPDIPHFNQNDGNVKLSAGWLIDKCQLKGIMYGGAAVYDKQALVLINKNNASSGDIIKLAIFVRKCVKKKFNIWLEPEVRFIGNKGEIRLLDTII